MKYCSTLCNCYPKFIMSIRSAQLGDADLLVDLVQSWRLFGLLMGRLVLLLGPLTLGGDAGLRLGPFGLVVAAMLGAGDWALKVCRVMVEDGGIGGGLDIHLRVECRRCGTPPILLGLESSNYDS